MTMMTDDSGTPDAGNVVMSSLMATGMLTGTISAVPPTVGYDAVGDRSTYTLTHAAASGDAFGVDINYFFSGRPMVQPYMDGTAGFGCNITITSGTASADTWVAVDNDSPTANKGTCTVSLSSQSIGSQGYITHGTLSVTAASMGGASSGSVTLTGTF